MRPATCSGLDNAQGFRLRKNYGGRDGWHGTKIAKAAKAENFFPRMARMNTDWFVGRASRPTLLVF
jgi:hypothetical protein